MLIRVFIVKIKNLNILVLIFILKSTSLFAQHDKCYVEVPFLRMRRMVCLDQSYKDIVSTSNGDELISSYYDLKSKFEKNYESYHRLRPDFAKNTLPGRLKRYHQLSGEGFFFDRYSYEIKNIESTSPVIHISFLFHSIFTMSEKKDDIFFNKIIELIKKEFDGDLKLKIIDFTLNSYVYHDQDALVKKYFSTISNELKISLLIQDHSLFRWFVKKKLNLVTKGLSPRKALDLVLMTPSSINYFISQKYNFLAKEDGVNLIDLLIEKGSYSALYSLIESNAVASNYYSSSGYHIITAFLGRSVSIEAKDLTSYFNIKEHTIVDRKHDRNYLQYTWIKHAYENYAHLESAVFKDQAKLKQEEMSDGKKLSKLYKALRELMYDFSHDRIDLKMLKKIVDLIDYIKVKRNLYLKDKTKDIFSNDELEQIEDFEQRLVVLHEWMDNLKTYKYSSLGASERIGADPIISNVGNIQFHDWYDSVQNLKIKNLLCLDRRLNTSYILNVNDFIVTNAKSSRPEINIYTPKTIDKYRIPLCDHMINLDRKDIFSYPFSYIQLPELYGSNWEDILGKDILSKDAEIIQFDYNNKNYRIKNRVNEKDYVLIVDNEQEVLFKSYCDLSKDVDGYDCGILTTLINAGDFNGDGKLDFYFSRRADGKSYPNKLYLSLPDSNGFQIINVDGGGC